MTVSIDDVLEELRHHNPDADTGSTTYDRLRNTIKEHINYLVTNDPPGLVHLLYKVDISESRIKALINSDVNDPVTNAIAQLLIDRQLQKAKSKLSPGNAANIPDDEKW